jgi:hypothetical protein
MRRDPIVEEVRRNRAAIAREHGNDLDAIVAAFQREQSATGVKTVSLRAKRVSKPAMRLRTVKSRRSNKAPQPTSRADRPGPRSKAHTRRLAAERLGVETPRKLPWKSGCVSVRCGVQAAHGEAIVQRMACCADVRSRTGWSKSVYVSPGWAR